MVENIMRGIRFIQSQFNSQRRNARCTASFF